MNERQYGIITFKSTHYAIRGDSIFKDKGIEYRLMPVPREITYSCGLAIRFNIGDLDLVKGIINEKQIQIDSIYKFIKDKLGNSFEKLL